MDTISAVFPAILLHVNTSTCEKITVFDTDLVQVRRERRGGSHTVAYWRHGSVSNQLVFVIPRNQLVFWLEAKQVIVAIE